MRTALIIGAFFAVLLTVPAVLWLSRLIRPPKAREDAIHRAVEATREDARRRFDRLRY